MAQPNAIPDTPHWYRQAWPWFLISLPASAVVGGIITIIIAVNSADPLVSDEYYKQGLAINQVKQRQAVAADLEMSGLLRSDNGQLSLALSASAPVDSEQLDLRVIHATRPELDREIKLMRSAENRYSAVMQKLPAGTWYLRVADPEQSWEIRSRIVTDGAFQAYLQPQT